MSPEGGAGDSRHALGRAGEAAAEAALGEAGMRILARRFRNRVGEIDLVALDGAVVVFVEVKTRSGTARGRPGEAVRARKRGRIAKVAQAFLSRNGLERAPCRFDVVEVVRDGDRLETRHVRDAFRLGLWR